jgi:hypothetical protein
MNRDQLARIGEIERIELDLDALIERRRELMRQIIAALADAAQESA